MSVWERVTGAERRCILQECHKLLLGERVGSSWSVCLKSLEILKPSSWSFYAQILDFALRKVKYYQCEDSCWEQCKWWSAAVAGLLVTKRVLHQFERFTGWSGAGCFSLLGFFDFKIANVGYVSKVLDLLFSLAPVLFDMSWEKFSTYKIINS